MIFRVMMRILEERFKREINWVGKKLGVYRVLKVKWRKCFNDGGGINCIKFDWWEK